MSYNFKSIADVEITEKPSESASVLIEEDGEIKRAPKSAVGGTSNSLVMVFSSDEWTDKGYRQILVPDNLYETVTQIFHNYANTELKLYKAGYDNLEMYNASYINPFGNDSYAISFHNCNYNCIVYPDGTVRFGEWD